MCYGMLNKRLGAACYLLRVRNVAESISAWHLAYEKDVVIQFWHTTHKPMETPPPLFTSHSTRVFFVLIVFFQN